MRHLPLTLALLLTSALHGQDDGFRCLANHPAELQRHLARTPGALERAMAAKAALDTRLAGFERGGDGAYIIPVVFHVIHNNGPENIGDAQLYDAIRVLNEDFNRLNPDWTTVRPEFLDIVGDVGIEFRLAKRDPQGNCTNGVTRTVSTRTYDGDFAMTQLIQWPRDRYMNVWVAASAAGAAGYTYYPIWLDGWPEADGIVILHNYTGSIGTSAPYRSRVLTHEVGHWLNLKHCWGDSNEPGSDDNCFMDDEVDDTPLTRGWTSCSLSGASCGSALDNVQNYMEYAYCSRMFTQGQGERMIAALTSGIAQRSNLWQPDNLQLTGVLEPEQLCRAQFQASSREVCAGSTVQFTDMSYFGVNQRFWSFPGGTPNASFNEQPVVAYDAPGSYPVTLTVSDGANLLSASQAGYIRVLGNPGDPLPWSEGFEAEPQLSDWWRAVNPDGDNGFEVTGAAAYSGARAVRILNALGASGRSDELISSTLNLTGAGSVSLSFRHAYARRNYTDDDALYVYVSGDCGQTWVLRKVMRAITTLVTAPQQSGSFVPSGPEQWGHTVMTNIGAPLHTSRFRVRFVFESDGGNNLYLDDINLTSTAVGVEESGPSTTVLRVFPNPAGTEAWVELPSAPTESAWSIVDAAGRRLRHGNMRPADARGGLWPLPLADLAPGTYLFTLLLEGQPVSTRFVVH
jgi:PKD repeat protein